MEVKEFIRILPKNAEHREEGEEEWKRRRRKAEAERERRREGGARATPFLKLQTGVEAPPLILKDSAAIATVSSHEEADSVEFWV